jgi:dTDP-4-dehydrorhamnose reductase
MKVLILGGTGMLGHQIIKQCIKLRIGWSTVVRDENLLNKAFGGMLEERFAILDDIKNFKGLEEIIAKSKSDFVINCVGVVKQSSFANDYVESLTINSLLPHQLEKICANNGARLVHISTDCVFDGKKGMYTETDFSDAIDLYGRSKFMGEISKGDPITLRTSIIGHELVQDTHGLVEWFLTQENTINGFTNAIFSGLTTLELSKLILQTIIPQNIPGGLYQVAAQPISKFDLLTLLDEVYGKHIQIDAFEDFYCNRSLNAEKFNNLTGYQVPGWSQLIKEMREDFQSNF